MSALPETPQPAGRLVAVNVGLPRDVEWQGRTVRTAIWKAPVDGPRMVRRLNVDGDGQADRRAHGGEHRAVFVYQLAAYRYWAEFLGREDFTHGQFGENFTVDGLPDDEVHIGDRFRIGDAEFEVTQPRVTCYRVAIRMDEPAMPSLLVSHHRPGFYLRVLKEGTVRPGDAIEQIAAGPEQMTVAEIDALLYLPGRSRGDLARAARIPALSAGWVGSFKELLATPPPTPAAWPGFRALRVLAVEPESSTITSFRLGGEDGLPAVEAGPGQYLTIRVRPGPDEPALVRNYSLSAPVDGHGLRISVKREGAASRFLHDALSPGDTLEVAAPRGQFVLDDQRERPVVLISAGVGATPVLAMLHRLADDAMPAPVWWIHSAHDGNGHAFAGEVDALLARLPDAHRAVFYTAEGAPASARFDVAGRLTPARLDALGLPDDADYYLCGPDRFMNDLSAALLARGVAPERVRSERFGTVAVAASGVVPAGSRPPHVPEGPAGTGPLVTFARSGLSAPWGARHGSLLDFAEACDIQVNFGCRTGVCQLCATPTLTGDVAYQPEPLEPPDAGHVLLCCSTPAGELVLDV